MNDKKQIEEMARDIEHCCNRYDNEDRLMGNKCNDCEYWCDTNNLCCSFGNKEASYLYNAGYRKLPEDSVVLTREEWKQIKNSLYYSKEALEKKLEKTRKETAERDFCTIVKALEERKERVKRFYGIAESVGADIAIRTVKDIAKQLGVEIGE